MSKSRAFTGAIWNQTGRKSIDAAAQHSHRFRRGQRLKIRRVCFEARRLGIAGRAEWKYNEEENGDLGNNAGISAEVYFMNNANCSRAALARGFMALLAVLTMGLGLARPAAAAPFAYVVNSIPFSLSGSVSVIDTATNMVAATVTVGGNPTYVAVTPDGQHAYVTNGMDGTVSVIATATNMVAATVTVGRAPEGVAITPDGTHAYVVNNSGNTVSVIATATNTVVATITVGNFPSGVAVAPDGKHAYVANSNFPDNGTVSVIATATNTVVATVPVGLVPGAVAVAPDGTHAYVVNNGGNTVSVVDTATNIVVAMVPVGSFPIGVAITPDGTKAYVTNGGSNTVSAIATASNTVVATVVVGNLPEGVAVTPDGTRAYVANDFSDSVSVIATANNTVGATVGVGNSPVGVGIIPDVPFAAFSPTVMINFGTTPNTDAFEIQSSFTLGSTSKGINPPAMPVTFQIGTFAVTIPPGSFTGTTTGSAFGPFFFAGTINGVSLHAAIAPTGANRFSFQAGSQDASLTGTANPVPVTLTIGNNSATASVTATIHP
ncbi:MAG: beta-propeller fold lactonase family protein [Methylocella sp.]